MISSKQVLVTGGQFTQQHYHGQASVGGNKAPIDMLMDAVAPSAFHDSGASFNKPRCYPRTRVKTREVIMHWILGEDKDARDGKQFMWLTGAAGCGKSAIAQSTIESCIERGLPLAGFFFSRQDPARNHAGSLVATLAYQLYCAFPQTEVQTKILSTIQQDPLIFKKTLQQQFTSLIIQPLWTYFSKNQFIQHQVPFLIAIDGLDECMDRTAQKAILTGLAESLRNSNLRIPIFVASRPEHDIRLSFDSKYLKHITTVLSLDLSGDESVLEADSDIRLYLLDRFAEIKDDFNNRTTGRKLAQDWPGDAVIGILVLMSSVIRYVESTHHRPDHRLEIILNLRAVNGDYPLAELDELYAMILESAVDIEKVLHVLSLYFMDTPPISCSVIEKMLSYDEGEVETLFSGMGALVKITKSTSPFPPRDREDGQEHAPSYLRMLLASFGEYLLDATRSKQFHIDVDYETIRHVTHALQYLALYCSSSLVPYSTAAAPMYIFHRNQCRVGRGLDSQSTISSELKESLLSFSVEDFLEPHTSTSVYPHLLEYFVTPFLELLETVVHNDPFAYYIQFHQLENIGNILMKQVRQYFEDDRLASVLILFNHMGSHRFVPVLEVPQHSPYRPYVHSAPFYLDSVYNDSDILSLSRIWESSTPFIGQSVYHGFLRQLLRLPVETFKYALGPKMHEKAALYCFEELTETVSLLPPPSGLEMVITTVTDDAEDDNYPKLSFNSANGGQWQCQCSTRLDPGEEELYFLLLGYIIFLLPCCGRSDALVAACENHRVSFIDQPDGPFPVRRRLLHKEINNYLARVSPILRV
ncbi:hypothetical protein D9613_006382 [Agrocybe pediades]|uniref:Nephrocystin 3-like N-terminal domain-containing protein n=1 Tax=Agrocybe pediades TaxID=84607 RepID=A0A8H4QV06_9AGAR|nr:hypothetical protein D9613_006382 [Agrocybe pediades]